jgi:RNA polymerase sigma-70 factor (ECF subfamily)
VRPTVHPSDEALVAALRRGDMAAFDTLYRRYEQRLFGYIKRQIPERDAAEDLFQDVLFTLLCDRSFDPRRGRFAAWLFTAARNRCLDHHRAARRVAKGRAAWSRTDASASTGEHGSTRIVEGSAVRAAIASLPEAQQQLLLLKQVGDLTYREIATLHGIPEGTVKSRLHAAVAAFRRALARLGETP